MKKAKELKKQADELNIIIDECMDSGEIKKALKHMDERNNLIEESFKIEKDAINELLNKRI